MTRDRELERFKTEINLAEYAQACGHLLFRHESSRHSQVLRHPDGDNGSS